MTINGILKKSLTNSLVGWVLLLGTIGLLESVVQFELNFDDKILFVLPLILFVSVVLWGMSIIIGVKELIERTNVWSSLISILLGGVGFFFIVVGFLLSSALP